MNTTSDAVGTAHAYAQVRAAIVENRYPPGHRLIEQRLNLIEQRTIAIADIAQKFRASTRGTLERSVVEVLNVLPTCVAHVGTIIRLIG